jgi:hypothetical protein
MSLYINRLTDGNSIIVLAADEQNARARAATLIVHEGVMGGGSTRERCGLALHCWLTRIQRPWECVDTDR